MCEAIESVNWLAVLAAALAYFVLGGIWFSPLFGKQYDKALGFERSKGQKWGALYYIMPMISAFVVSIATAILLGALKVTEFSEAVCIGLLVGVGYSAAISFNNAVTPNTPHPLLYGAVTGGYHIAGAVLVAVLITSISH